MQYVPADRLMLLQSHGVYVLPYYHQKNNAGVCVLDEGAKKISPAVLVNTHISCSITIIILPWATAFPLIYDWHPTDNIPA